MKLREEIEKSFSQITVQAGNEGFSKLLFEVLLDIRQLLMEDREDSLENKITQAREQVEAERREELKKRISIK